MLPQNGIQGNRPNPGASFTPGFDGGNTNNYFSGPLDPAQAAKQMAALSAASQARMAARPSTSGISSGTFPGGTHSMEGQITNGLSPANPSFLDPPMAQNLNAGGRPGMAPHHAQRRTGMLNGLANMMIKRNTPLPPAFTGVPTPNYDPATSQFSYLEPTGEVGVFRLCGKDIDLYKVWSASWSHGGYANIANTNGWHLIVSDLELPEHASTPFMNGSTAVAPMIQHHFVTILLPFEELYRRNMAEQQQQRKNLAARPGAPGSVPNTPGSRQSTAQAQSPTRPTSVADPSTPQTEQDTDTTGTKRKLDSEDLDAKRARAKTDETEDSPSTNSAAPGTSPAPLSAPRSSQQPTRKKIEYVPLAREVETFGGRDLQRIEMELAHPHRRQMRDLTEWGAVDIEHVTMSIRSRLPTELSYALTTLSVLSTLKSPNQPNSGFPIQQCGEMFEEVLDLLEDCAFQGLPDEWEPWTKMSKPHLITHRDLVNVIHETVLTPFGALDPLPGSSDGIKQRPAAIILAILNLVRNLSVVPDNVGFLAAHPRLLPLLLRLCDVDTTSHPPSPASPNLSLTEVAAVRKDTLYTLTAVASNIGFGDLASRRSKVLINRVFALVVSFLIDPSDTISPLTYAQQFSGGAPTNIRAPLLADIALDVFTRLAQPDPIRHAISQAVPRSSLIQLFTSLVHRLPVVDGDFALLRQETWLAYTERLCLAIYIIAFLAPPDLKSQLKADRSLGFKGVMLHMLQRFMAQQESRAAYVVCVRRVVETMKVLDDGEDVFDTSKSTIQPTLSFGMGYGEVGEDSVEKGTGLLGGNRGAAWDILMTREAAMDEVLFRELESLARVDISC